MKGYITMEMKSSREGGGEAMKGYITMEMKSSREGGGEVDTRQKYNTCMNCWNNDN